jgi:hypothetical protein
LSLMLLLCGVILLLNPLFNLKKYRRYKRRTAITTGTVLGQEEQRSQPGTFQTSHVRTDHAIVEYMVNGNPYQCVSESGATWTTFKTGTSVSVCYDPDDPENADILKSHQSSMLMISLLVKAGPVIGSVLVVSLLWRIF